MGEEKRDREKGASFFENLLVITEAIIVLDTLHILLISHQPLKITFLP